MDEDVRHPPFFFSLSLLYPCPFHRILATPNAPRATPFLHLSLLRKHPHSSTPVALLCPCACLATYPTTKSVQNPTGAVLPAYLGPRREHEREEIAASHH